MYALVIKSSNTGISLIEFKILTLTLVKERQVRQKGVHKTRLIISTRNPRLDTKGNRSTKQNEKT